MESRRCICKKLITTFVLNSFVRKHRSSTIHELTKLKDSLIKRLDKDEMSGIERLPMQLSYSWLDSFVGKKSGKYNGRERF